MRLYTLLGLLLMIPALGSAQAGPLSSYELSEGGFALLGSYFRNYKPDTPAPPISHFYIDDVEVLKEMQAQWVSEKVQDQWGCNFQFDCMLTQNGVLQTAFSVAPKSLTPESKSGSFEFNSALRKRIVQAAQIPIVHSQKFESQRFGNQFVTTNAHSPSLLLQEQPAWLTAEGSFTCTYLCRTRGNSCLELKETIPGLLKAQIDATYRNEPYELEVIGGDFTSLTLQLTCNKSLYDAFDIFEEKSAWTAFPKEMETWWRPFTERPDWGDYFEEVGLTGTIVLLDPATRHAQIYNRQRADSAYLPASTFKIPNSLISLEAGAVPDVETVIPWDGRVRFVESWNQDQTMRSAFKYSAYWFYQETARRVGKAEMQNWLDQIQYGNQSIGGEVDQFWLDNSLQISAVEQVKFLYRFFHETLPFSSTTQIIVKDIMLAEATDQYQLYAKTGWGVAGPKEIGWYVGWVTTGVSTRIFALNLDITKNEDTSARIEITRKILQNEGFISP